MAETTVLCVFCNRAPAPPFFLNERYQLCYECLDRLEPKSSEHALRVLFHCLAVSPRFDIVRKALDLHPALVNYRDELTLKTLLHLHAEAISPTQTYSPEYSVDMSDLPNILRILVGRGADVNARDERGATPLMGMIRVLPPMDLWAYREGTTSEQSRILHNSHDKAEALLQRGADPNLPTLDKWYPITMLATKGHPWTVSTLSDYGADLHVKTGGKTALEWAESSGNHDAAQQIRWKLEDELG